MGTSDEALPEHYASEWGTKSSANEQLGEQSEKNNSPWAGIAQDQLRSCVYAPTANSVERAIADNVRNSQTWAQNGSGPIPGAPHHSEKITINFNRDSSNGTLRLTDGDKTLLSASVVVGGKDHPTPTGNFHAAAWEKDHTSKLYGNNANTPWSKTSWGRNAFGPYQLHIRELESRGIFIHGTIGPGSFPFTWGNRLISPNSHGCVRMSNKDINSLHNQLPNPEGIPINISSY
jgi:lipoprotein-anchoring transpeptidase ErfK/SrfK